METHGSESYFVIGEGLFSESIGGRDGDGPRVARRPPRQTPFPRSVSRAWVRMGPASRSLRRWR